MIDGGVTDAGIPYLVMEFVDGAQITRYAAMCDFSVRQRAELFLTVCRAVEAAHRNLIVHRDIKPSNILVSNDGVVKLLDFGIAKLLEEDNTDATGTVGVFTPNYAAPEQIQRRYDHNGDRCLRTRRDVARTAARHSAGRRALAASVVARDRSVAYDAVRRRHDHSRQQMQLRTALRGDLDNILLKAMARKNRVPAIPPPVRWPTMSNVI